MLAIQFEPPKTQDVWSQSVLYMEAYNLKNIYNFRIFFSGGGQLATGYLYRLIVDG